MDMPDFLFQKNMGPLLRSSRDFFRGSRKLAHMNLHIAPFLLCDIEGRMLFLQSNIKQHQTTT